MPSIQDSSIEQELSAGERLLWKGRPRSGIRLQASDAFLIPFSLVWGGFAIFWEISVLTRIPRDQVTAWVFPLFGLPFVLIGFYIIFGRFLVDARRRERTEYAVTNQRAIIASGVFSRKIRSINLRSTPDITLTEKSDKSGTITFGASMPAYGWWTQGNQWFPGMAPLPSAFEAVENVRAVYEIVRKAQGS
jgi:hypothetical protein